MTRRSTYDLKMALNYLRLAYQSMSRDPFVAEATIKMILEPSPDGSVTDKDRLRALAHAVAWKTKELDDEASR